MDNAPLKRGVTVTRCSYRAPSIRFDPESGSVSSLDCDFWQISFWIERYKSQSDRFIPSRNRSCGNLLGHTDRESALLTTVRRFRST